MQAYMSVALNHLLQWVDKGTVPPKADRIMKEGTAMALDDRGNPRGGIRSPYVDFPIAKYAVHAPEERAVAEGITDERRHPSQACPLWTRTSVRRQQTATARRRGELLTTLRRFVR